MIESFISIKCPIVLTNAFGAVPDNLELTINLTKDLRIGSSRCVRELCFKHIASHQDLTVGFQGDIVCTIYQVISCHSCRTECLIEESVCGISNDLLATHHNTSATGINSQCRGMDTGTEVCGCEPTCSEGVIKRHVGIEPDDTEQIIDAPDGDDLAFIGDVHISNGISTCGE